MIGYTSQKEWEMQYLIAVLDRSELQHHLSVAEVDRLTDQDMQDIAQAMKDELSELGFYDFMALVARCKLAEKQGTSNGT